MKLRINIWIIFFVLIGEVSCSQENNNIKEEIQEGEKVQIKNIMNSVLYADWENGQWNSGIDSKVEGPTMSFSYQGAKNSQVVSWYANGERDNDYNPDIHGAEVIDIGGDKVLRVWADGTGRPSIYKDWIPSSPFSNRSEISWHKFMTYEPRDEIYLTYSFKPAEDSWNSYTRKYPTIITQYKEFSSGPFFEIFLSNEGLNPKGKLELFTAGNYYIDNQGNKSTKKTFDKTLIGEIDPAEWTTVKVFMKATAEDDGFVKIWLSEEASVNEEPVFSYSGRTLIQQLPGKTSYTKIGHYGQIFEKKKVTYFDNVHIAKEIDIPLSDWIKEKYDN
jgi:hypothetical protein